jgi:putative membrane protein
MKLFALATAGLLVVSAAATASAQGPTDPQIASIVVTANQVDIDAGKLASATSKNAEVMAFAKMMVTDHTGVNKQAVALVTKLKVTPEDNPTSQSLKDGGVKNLANLKTLKGAAFDKAYIDHEVAYHQQVIDAVDKVLIPNAKNAELKALIVKVRPAFLAHLDHAKMVQSALAGK